MSETTTKLRRPSEEHPQVTINDESQAVLMCLFRTCHWNSQDVRTMALAEQDAMVRRHLLGRHRDQIETLAALLDGSR